MRAPRHARTDSAGIPYERLLEAAGVGVLEFDENGVLRRASPLALSLLGAPGATGGPEGEAPPLPRTLAECVAEAARRDGAVATAVIKGRGGAPLEATVLGSHDGIGQGLVACLLRLAASESTAQPSSRDVELLEAMVEASQDGLTIVGATGSILKYNSRAAQLNGIQQGESVGRHVGDLVRTGYFDHSVTLDIIRRRADVTAVQTVRDGRKLLVSGRPIFSTDGELRYVVLTERDVTEMNRLVTRLQETTRLSERYRAELRMLEMREVQAGEIVSRSAPMQAVRELAMRCAVVDSPVLLLGETGTGKGVFAKLIHQSSTRGAGPFLEVNCGAIPEGLLEAELFGYTRGAFTGADPKGKVGMVELADTGTLFLNEIGDLPLKLQVKLLRFLEDGEIQPVGSVARKRPDVRIMAATNRDLADMLAQGTFRQDLFYRLNVLMIRIPPLRERREDIPWLVEMMLGQLARKLHRRPKLTPAALHAISQYAFPGNVRELWNLIERLAVTTDANTIDVGDLPIELSQRAGLADGTSGTGGTLREVLERVEAAVLRDALARWKNQAVAARHLGVGQATISRKVKQYGLR